MNRSAQTIFALDIGSTCVRAIVGRALPDERVQVLSVFEVEVPQTAAHTQPAQSELIKAICEAAGQAMSDAEERVQNVWLAVPSNFVEVVEGVGEVFVERGTTRREHVEAALENAELPHLSATRRVIHRRIMRATIDGKPIDEPYIDVAGKHLRMEAQMVICASRELQHRIELVKLAGFRPQGVLLETLAAASATLKPVEIAHGVAMIDLGAKKTSIGVWKDGVLRDVMTIDTGGVSFTEDLAMSLRIPLAAAARVQEESYCACVPHLSTHAPLEIPVDGQEVRRVTPLAIAQILEPRVSELLAEVVSVLQAKGYDKEIRSVVVTGGGAWMRGFRELAEEHFSRYGWETRLGLPQGLSLGGELVSQTRYATLVGLLREASSPHARHTFFLIQEQGVKKQITDALARFFDSFF